MRTVPEQKMDNDGCLCRIFNPRKLNDKKRPLISINVDKNMKVICSTGFVIVITYVETVVPQFSRLQNQFW
jgi:hypothetical protein